MSGKTGTSMQYAGAHLALGRSLNRAAEQVANEERKKALAARHAKVQKIDGRIGNRTRFSDADVAEMRRLHEQDKMRRQDIAIRYGAHEDWVYMVLDYQIRSRYIYA